MKYQSEKTFSDIPFSVFVNEKKKYIYIELASVYVTYTFIIKPSKTNRI